jgi:hypothetical protein
MAYAKTWRTAGGYGPFGSPIATARTILREWDEWTDHLTVLDLTRTWDDQSLSVRASIANPYIDDVGRAAPFLMGRSFRINTFTYA